MSEFYRGYYSKMFNHCSMKWCIAFIEGENKTMIHHAETEEEADRLMKLLKEE